MRYGTTRVPIDLDAWVRQGAIGGFLGGLGFAAYTMVFAAVMEGPDAFFSALRPFSAIVIGPGALDPGSSLLVAAATGALVHFAFALFFGVVFAAAVAFVPALRHPPMSLPVSASTYGAVLWLVNIHVVAPAADWLWIADVEVATAQLLAHTFAFGLVLGLYLDRALVRPRLRAMRRSGADDLERLHRVG